MASAGGPNGNFKISVPSSANSIIFGQKSQINSNNNGNGLLNGLNVTITRTPTVSAENLCTTTTMNGRISNNVTITKSHGHPVTVQSKSAIIGTDSDDTTNLSNSNSASATARDLNQALLVAFATKLMGLNATDEILKQELLQRMLQGRLEQNEHKLPSPTRNFVEQNGPAPVIRNQPQTQPLNHLKIPGKFLSDLALQIFMHKSVMQLQQQHQALTAEDIAHHGHGPMNQEHEHEHDEHGHGHGHGHIRPGSVSPSESDNGLPKSHQCHQCLKSFSSNHQLVQHVRVHTGEKPYKCSYCERRFKQLSHVQQHTRLHTGERPYRCHVVECGRAFIQLSNLQQHLRNHDAQLERSKNRPFHCSICGKGFATESSLRTHNSKVCKDPNNSGTQTNGSNPAAAATACPICHKFFMGGEALMDHMKHTHKDPNASGVATKRRTSSHVCPVCGKHYVNEGSLRKHLTCHPEAARFASTLRMWPCSVCQAVFTHEAGLLPHMEQMRSDPKHQFAAQYLMTRTAAAAAAASNRRGRDTFFAAAAMNAMAGVPPFGTSSQGQPIPPTSASTSTSTWPMMTSPSGSESSGRLSPLPEANTRHLPRPLDARTIPGMTTNDHQRNIDKYDAYDKFSSHRHYNMAALSREPHYTSSTSAYQRPTENDSKFPTGTPKKIPGNGHSDFRASFQGHGHGHPHSHSGEDMMSSMASMQAEALIRSQAAEAIRQAVDRFNVVNTNGNHLHLGQTEQHGGNHGGHEEFTHAPGISSHHHQWGSLLTHTQQELSDSMFRQLENARSLGPPLPAHNS